ncbi:ATP-binding protein [Leptotrichia sp. OH3620_COT-345]|uniref:YifB family Mg chelatase-like AAA ATPase n=1 Tax=Leptotrichia sp. OH3620_COT-345 TaxID=2491048 RepID=UPI000F652A33|nr:YifB family Mg chelatase-like AAA ATPase [Leptotrichia sp. OH3620_COT-345]RRD38903.1 ATP-binding protein [Leptotrichia sp. OH3620_COT-345]
MAISVLSCSYLGVESYIVEVEADVSNGLPVFNIVGMGDQAIKESKERIRNCFKNMKLEFPIKRVLVNLSPADVRKKGSHFDLPIFLGILANIGKINNMEKFKDYLILGEISLNGDIKPIKGAINAAILAKERKIKGVIVPLENYNEAKLISGVKVVPVTKIKEAADFLNEEIFYEKLRENAEKYCKVDIGETSVEISDFSDVKGQILAKRALEIAAAGGHNIFLMGDPGSGKSMLAKRFITILPEMTESEIIETTKIYSISGMLSDVEPIIKRRPFRAPHHSATQTALIGGALRAGEITLALNGVFFMDELGEFSTKTLEALRQPLEDGNVTVSRANLIITYPVNNIVIAASNPTPGGFFADDPRCKDSLRDIKNYQKKFSGPLLDRMDIYVEMRRLNKDEIFSEELSETSEKIRRRVISAREIQKKRFNSDFLNSKMSGKQILKYCKINKETKQIFEKAVEELNLSMRMYDKVLKVSRTIADLDGSQNIEIEHLLEALNYRKKY